MEWNIDAIAARNLSNAAVSGDDPANIAITATTRVGNFMQISEKTIQIADENSSVESPDENNTMGYQIAKKLKELKLDVDAIASQEQASVAPTTSVAGKAGGFESWITTNDSRTGTQGGYSVGTGLTVAPTNGTQRALSEQFLKDVLQLGYTAGAKFSTVLFGPFNMNQASAVMTGIAQPVRETNNDKVMVIAAADVYKSPWGQVKFMPSRNTRDRSALVLDPEYWKVGFLRPFQVRELAKTGDSERKQAIVQWTLISRNEKSSGIIADLTTS